MTVRCQCHSIREGSGGQTYSYAIIGVLCPACEAEMEEAQWQAEFDALPREEQIRLEIAGRWYEAMRRMSAVLRRRPGSPVLDEPPF
jgi:hypothetical protein